jgi:hypothetical protein
MSARWGIDCNLAPAFLLFGFYFFVLGADNAKYFLLSALFYGLSLYCYITIWPILPVLIILMTLYLIYTKKLHFGIYHAASICILALLALPLILFLLVNNGYIAEITTPVISVPKLSAMRGSEISWTDKLWKLKNNLLMLLRQNDDLYWNATEKFGLYYKGFMLFAIPGGIFCLKRFISSIIHRKYDPVSLLLFPFVCALMLCSLITANFNRMNCIHIPISVFIGIGMYLCGHKFKHCNIVVYALVIICFICFETYYFTDFREEIACEFQEGLEDAVQCAMNLTDGTIYVEDGFIYSKILFYAKVPAPVYLSTLQYNGSRVSSFDRFIVEPESFPDEGVFIILPESAGDFSARGFNIERFGYAAVAYK